WSRKSRGAEISLWVTLLFVSLLVLGAGALLGAARISGTVPGDVYPPGLLAVTAGAVSAAGVAGLILCVPPLLKIVGRRPEGFFSDPPTFLALWLFAMVLLTNNVIGILGFDQLEEIGAFSLGTGGRLSVGLILATQLPFVAVAVLGVGVGIRRGIRPTLARLGYGPLSLNQLGVVAVFVAGAFTLSLGADFLFRVLQPELYRDVGEISGALFDPRGLGLATAILFALLIGLGAGLGEETLFRGAVQPALGIVPTSILFASMHVQYGPSLLLGYIFVLSIGLGYLRRRFNTTASFLAHAAYNFIGVMAAYLFTV
ncbi:MAG TPA: CPBP family intramembrane glutamic endopeptidase, partial [Rubrobacteraceae bacterium]|nr:CPBP family intramembrane glutamic endopeptidase [Rubrobacteraceae bacterium]